MAILFLSGLVFGFRYYTGEGVFSPEEKEGIAVPILMYHNITDKAVGSKYTVTAAELESDLNYIEEKGYTAVGINDLIAYTKGEGELPDKPVVLTFD
ncbi:MAG: hypothetical protein LUH47_02355, partial [Clostridiales bacterium]|nr:hypothetical protein [Clostridiales bacterium]